MARRKKRRKDPCVTLTQRQANALISAVWNAYELHSNFLMHDDWQAGRPWQWRRKIRAQNAHYTALARMLTRKVGK